MTLLNEIKEYWNRRPCNINHSKKEKNTKEYFDEVEAKKYKVEYHIPRFAEFEKTNGLKMLEVGCGIGTDATNFVRHGAIYTGIELSENSLEITKTRFNVFDLQGDLRCMSGEDLEYHFESESFDLAYSFGVIHHAENPEIVFDQIYKVLKKGGTFKFMVYAKNSWKKFMIDNGLDQYEAQSACPQALTYTKDDIYELLKDKYENIEIKQEHIFPYKVDDYKEGRYVKHEYFESMPEDVFRILEENIGWHLCVTCTKM